MGLDNRLVFKIKCPSFNLEREYEVCYFRKYWRLRDKILKILNKEQEEYLYPVLTEDLYAIKDLFEYYSKIENTKDADLSTIWNWIEETYHIRTELTRLQFAIDFCENKISLHEFLEALCIWEESWKRKQNSQADERIEETPPEDLEWCFEFYDSY